MSKSGPADRQGPLARAIYGFVLGGVTDRRDAEMRRRFGMINVISAIGILNMVPLGVMAWLQGNPILGVIDHAVAAILVANLLYLRSSGRYLIAAGTGILVVAGLFLYLLVTGGVNGTGHLWFYTFPLIASFLLGSRAGAISSTAMLLLGALPLTALAGRTSWVHAYDGEFVIRFLLSYLVVLAYSYFFERFREEAHRALEERNDELAEARGQLKEKVEERTAELHRANAELRNTQARFATVLDSIDANVYAADMATHEILFANRRMVEHFGEDLIGGQCFRALRGQAEPCPTCTNESLLDENGRPTGVVTWEGRNEPTGDWYVHHDRAVEWVDGRYVRLQVATDLTVRKEAEEENARLLGRLAQAHKMEAIGTLAGGVAHDLNNILTAILGYPDLMLLDLPEDSPLRAPLETIRDSAEKSARIVSDLLTLARRGASRHDPVRLSEVAAKFLKSPEYLSLRTLHPDVEITSRLAADLPPFSGSEVHIFTTLLNLVTNACEAMPSGGRLTVQTARCRLEEPVAGLTTVPAGDYALLTVSDTGVGIPAEDLPRIFEPFYTRKTMGRSGTGLGMAVVWGAVVDHHGYVDVRTAPGEGSEFRVYFPLPEAGVLNPPPEEEETPAGRGELVLIVDDDEVQRELAGEILTMLGYRAETASSGEEAVEFVRRERPGLVLLDMIMEPGVDGLETYRQILEFAPRQRAIIISGYAETNRVAGAQRLGAGAYLKKPYLVQELAGAVRCELDREPRDE